ncbi:YggS family pyridoxal phosphate enzyme [Arthrobacter sp. Sr24]
MNLQDPRTRQLAERLDAVKARISAARTDVVTPTLIVVTKFHPAADVLRLHSLGVADVGENRDQEAAAKALEVAGAGAEQLRWHFIGQLQKNKAKSVVTYAHSVQSIDRGSLVKALENAMVRELESSGRAPLECFIQVDLSESYAEFRDPTGQSTAATQPTTSPSGRGGAAPSSVMELADQITGAHGLRLAGLMAVAPLGVAPEPAFDLLATVSARLVAEHPNATAISAGMSHDLEAALAAGATHLRVGSDILGPRPVVL